MSAEPLDPHCPILARTVQVGGLTRSELVEALRARAIAMNELAERLFASEWFTTSATRYSVLTLELTVRDLGFPRGATWAEIDAAARALGLALCPLELGPHLRLQYLDQPEGDHGSPVRRHRAPAGALTVASEPVPGGADFPTGFYLRRIRGTLWLRGYRSGPEHRWEPDDRFVFVKQ